MAEGEAGRRADPHACVLILRHGPLDELARAPLAFTPGEELGANGARPLAAQSVESTLEAH